MKVNYAGRHELSTVDWPGHASYVVFLRGCPMSCPNCHNAKIRTGDRFVDFDEIAQDILSSRRYISALVISGGEPVMQPEVCLELLIWGHALGLKVGIETSGCRPIPDGFDLVFISLQCPLERWIYDSYTKDLKAYDNVIYNLDKLDPKTTEVRYVVHKNEYWDIGVFKYIHDLGFSIRLLKGEGISLEELNSISIELSIVLGSDIKDGVIL